MSAFYEVYGAIRVRRGPEVDAIVARLLDRAAGEIGVAVEEVATDVLEVSLEGGDFFAAGGALELDDRLKSLGPYTVEPAVLATRYDGEEGELVVAHDEAGSREALSRHRLGQIDALLQEVTPGDRARLAARLRAP